MTDEEWGYIADMIGEWWGGVPFDEHKATMYRMALNAYDPQDVVKALNVLLRRGGSFRPTTAEIVGVLGGTSTYATPHEAWALIEQAIAMIPGGVSDPKFNDRHQAAVDWLRTQDEAVAAWAAQRGLRGRGSLGAEEVHHPQFGGAVTKRLHEDFGDVTRLAVERSALGQPPFPERAFLVKATGDGSGGIAALVERLRPKRRALLGEGQPDE